MTTENPPQPRLTLLQEFQASYRVGPRAWRCAGLFLVASLLFPFVAWWVILLAGAFLLTAFFGAALGRLVADARDARTLRRFQVTLRRQVR